MVNEIQSQCDTGALLHTTTLSKAQKRWRLAYFSISFSNTILSIAKLSNKQTHYPISENVSSPSYTAIKIIPKASNFNDHGEPFSSINKAKLTDLVTTKDLEILSRFDGVEGLAKSLETDLENGIIGEDTERRRRVFGSNTYKKPPPKGFVYFVAEAFMKDTTNLILLASAVVSMGFGIREDGGWHDAGSIFVAVFMVIVVSATINLRQERLLSKINGSNDIQTIQVIRDGRSQHTSVVDVVVGDLVILSAGDQVPVDGLLVDGNSLKLVGDPCMTGESDHVDLDAISNPFLPFASRVGYGHGRMLVTSVGMSCTTSDRSDEQTPLQTRITKLTSSIGKVGLAVASLDLLVMLIRFSVGYTRDENGNWKSYKGGCTDTTSVLDSVARDLLAIPEGLPLAVTLILVYSLTRMMADQVIVRKLPVCETMGSATVICIKFKNVCLNYNGRIDGVKEAIETCRSAGVDIKMVTEDNVFTANETATACGILKPGQVTSEGEVIEGEEFRNYTEEERMNAAERILVMARSSPSDKLQLVQSLQKRGHVVVFTGDDISDVPAMETADMALSMGIGGSGVAMEASDMVILVDDFASVVMGLRWGRCVYNNIQKVIQFHLTANVAALVINFVMAASVGGASLTPIQALWVNFIISTLGGIALATDRPSKELMRKPPMRRDAPLVTKVVWRNLLAQSLYQVVILLTLQFKGRSVLEVSEGVKNTMVFNTFVLCQVFNVFSSTNLEKPNVFKGLVRKNKLFLGIIGVTIMLQVVMVEFLNNFADTQKLSREEWGVCISYAALSLPIGWLVKLIP